MQLYPMTFTKKYITKIWGGNKIKEYFSRHELNGLVGESWEIADVDGYESIIANGFYQNEKISRIFNEKIMGDYVVNKYTKFPLIIKYIDANDNLSVQVHPKKGSGENTKNEIWYFIAPPDEGKIICGLRQGYDINKIGDYLKYVQAEKESTVFIPTGIVHALTKGSFILEVQESCDITYRLYDYERKQTDGTLRELHVEQGEKHIDNSFSNSDCICEQNLIKENDSVRILLIKKSEYFTLEKWELMGRYKTRSLETSFSVLNPLDGDLKIICNSGEYEFQIGESILIPAYLGDYEIYGNCTIIHSYI